jgi:glucuronate isomerase
MPKLAKKLYEEMAQFPIISPHGHVDAKLLAANENWNDAVDLLIRPDHYITRMLYSQGISYEEFKRPSIEVWRIFCANWKLFAGTPSSLWLSEILNSLFDIDDLSEIDPDKSFAKINERLASPEFKPLALFKRFNIEVLATTDSTNDDLAAHKKLQEMDISGHVIPTFRPDDVTDPARADFKSAIEKLGATSFASLLSKLTERRAHFKSLGATATDHGIFSPQTLKMNESDKEKLFTDVMNGQRFEEYRAVMLFEFAKMSAADGLVMQLHPGSYRNYDTEIYNSYGPDKGFDIPTATTYTSELRPLLNEVGKDPNFRMVLFTLDESTYSRELAPLAGAYPAVRLGPPWWFHDSINGMRRWRDATVETAGFYNTVGFIDDTRAFCSIPARHKIARKFDAKYLAEMVDNKIISEKSAFELAPHLAYKLSKDFFRL